MAQAFVTLVSGGHAAGKRTVCEDLKRRIETEVPSFRILLIDLYKYQLEDNKPSVDFAKCIHDIENAFGDYEVILVHGCYALYDTTLCEMAQLRIFVDTDADTRLSQWILRDVSSGKKHLDNVLDSYLQVCRPEFLDHIDDTRKNADLLLPRGSDKLIIDVLSDNITDVVISKETPSREAWRSQASMPINLRKETMDAQDSRYYAAV